jgi:hypothetical protein
MRQNKDLEQNADSVKTHFALEHFQAWWNTKRLRIMRQNKNLEQNADSVKTHFALVQLFDKQPVHKVEQTVPAIAAQTLRCND